MPLRKVKKSLSSNYKFMHCIDY